MVVIPTPVADSPHKDALQVKIPNRYLNILLLGSDKRPTSRAWRTDSMIIVSVDMEDRVVRLLSIPRDLYVYIPRHGHDRINTAELWGELAKKGTGVERVKQTIYHNLGIPIHYYARVDFQGFIKIIDTVGGVDIDVDCPLPDIKLHAGMHHMDGKQALLYSRSRKSTSDIDRGRRQRKVLMALWEQALTPDMIPRLPKLWITMADSFQTDLPLDQVISLAYIGVQLKPQHILSRAITHKQVKAWMTPQGAAVLVPTEGKLRAFLEDYYAPIDTAGLDAPQKVRVEVLNGLERPQVEQLAAAELRRAGFKVVGTALADRQNYAHTEIQILNGDIAAGERAAEQLNVPANSIHDLTGTKEPNPADILIILGRDYDPCRR
jgi:LCP family protein required for cell wall assembly